MKGLKWLKKEVKKLETEESQRYPHWEAVWMAEVINLIEQVEQSDPSEELRHHILKEEYRDMAKQAMIIFEAYMEVGFTRQEALEILINMMIGG